MEMVDHAAQGRTGHRDLAGRIRRGARHRTGVDSRHLRSGTEPVHRRHRQSESGDGGEEPQGRQPLYLLDRGDQSGYREDGLVFPAIAARHARLGRGGDARAVRRRRSTGSRANWWRRPAATATSLCWTARPASSIVDDAVHRHAELGEGLRREGPADSRSREVSRPPTACWSRRPRTARPTGRRRASIRRPGCSTSAPAAPTACIT